MNIRTTGLIVAAGMLCILAGVVAYAFLNYTPDETGRQTISRDAALEGLPRTIAATSEATPLDDSAIATERGVWTRLDPATDRVELKLSWQSLEPMEAGSFEMTGPRAWFIREQTAIRVSASHASVLWPTKDREPESGQLSGNVTIDVFSLDNADAAARLALSDESPQPDATFTTPALAFQSALMELSAPGEVRLEARGIQAMGEGLTLRVNEADRRLKLLEITRFRSATIDPVLARKGEDEPENAAPGSAQSTADTAPAKIVEYLAKLDGRFTIEQGPRTLVGERIELWARLIDGALPEGAIAPLQASPAHQNAAPADRAKPGATLGDAFDPATPILVTADGPITIRPIRTPTPHLKDDHAFLSIAAPESHRVELIDESSGAYLHCVSLEYALTTRRLSALGLASTGVVTHVPGVVDAVVGRFDQDLTTGRGAFPGPGRITVLSANSADRFGDENASISWQGGADFLLDTTMGTVGATGTIIPISIDFDDRIETTWSGHDVSADHASATFGTLGDAAASSARATLEAIEVTGNAIATTPDDARVAAESIRVEFETDPRTDRAYPTSARAQGDVRAEDPRGSLSAETVDLVFQRDGDTVDIGSVRANLGVYIEAGSDITVEADSFVADMASRTIEIMGSPAVLSQNHQAKRQTISGDTILIEESTRRFTVPGAGHATYTVRREDATGYDNVRLDWKQQLFYDDLTGYAEVEGEPTITAERSSEGSILERHVGSSRLIVVHRAPFTAFETEAAERPLIRAELIGDPVGHGAPAEIDLRRYRIESDAAAPRALDGLINLRGPRIVVDVQARKLIVPDAGVLVIEDRRVTNAPGPDHPDDFPQVQGTTGFWWDGSLTLDEAAGRATMSDRVRMVHVASDSEIRTELECESLTADFEIPRADSTDAGAIEAKPRLAGVAAAGAVFVQHADLELVCDKLQYDATNERITAQAMPGNRITVHDAAQQAHVVADAVAIDARTGQWQITRGAGTLSPR